MRTLLVTVELVSASIWVGGLVAIALVGGIVRTQLAPPARVEFFRVLGRRYLVVGGASLVLALVCGGVLLAAGDWTPARSAAVGVAVALVLVTTAGVIQARALTRARRVALAGTSDAGLRRRTLAAAALRMLIAVLTVVLVVLAAVLAA